MYYESMLLFDSGAKSDGDDQQQPHRGKKKVLQWRHDLQDCTPFFDIYIVMKKVSMQVGGEKRCLTVELFLERRESVSRERSQNLKKKNYNLNFYFIILQF